MTTLSSVGNICRAKSGVLVLILCLGIVLNASTIGEIFQQMSVNIIPLAKAQSTPSVFPIESKPYGKTYGDWSTTWWQSILAIPIDKNPLKDNTGKDCSQGQSGPIWFLAGTGGGAVKRTCTIPAGKAVMFPVFNGECSYAEFPQYKSESDLRKCAKDQLDKVTNLDASVDGVKIPDLKKYRAQSPLFDVVLPSNNVFGAPPGPTKSVADGFWIIIAPFSTGNHNIHFAGSAVDVTSSGVTNFATDVTYDLTVQ
jgi:hypothetical protein